MEGFENIMSYVYVKEFNSYMTKLLLEENVKNEVYGVSADILFTFKFF